MPDILPNATADAVPKGIALVEAIEAECQLRGVDPKDVGAQFELQPSYWNLIISRTRSVQGLHRRRLRLVADFLSKSMVEVMSLAELVEPGDFVVRNTLDDQLNLAYKKISADPTWSPLLPRPSTWDRSPRETKLCLALMYERLNGEEMIAKSSVRAVVPAKAPAPSPATAAKGSGSGKGQGRGSRSSGRVKSMA